MCLLISCLWSIGEETKSEAQSLGPAQGSVPFANVPLSPCVQRGSTWCCFHEMLCLPDPKCLNASEGAQPIKPRLLKMLFFYFNRL